LETFANIKINTKLEFPDTLDLKEYSFRNACELKQENKDSLKSNELLYKFATSEDDEFIYRLVGVNIHAGTA